MVESWAPVIGAVIGAAFSADGPSPTIRGVNRPVPLGHRPHRGDATRDMGLVRPLIVEERAALQAFPPDYAFEGSAMQQELQVGNAVPPLLAAAVARAVRGR